MTHIGMKLGLDVSGFVAGAGSAARKIEDITEAMAKAEREGRHDDVARLARDKEGLDPAGAILSKTDALGGVIRDLDARIAEAKKKGNEARAGELYFAKDRLQTAAEGMERDAWSLLRDPKLLQIMNKKAEGQTLTREEEQYFARIETLSDALRKNTEALLEANRDGDTKELLRRSNQIGEGARDLRNIAGQGAEPQQSGRGMQGAVMSLALGHISSAISSGLSRWAGSLDRSGIVAQYGSGDIMGARLAERRRQDNLVGGAMDSIAGVSNMLAFLGPKGMVAAGAINLGTSIFNSVRQARTNEEATNVAKADLWQQRSGQAMELAALMGRPGGVREAFGIAADAAARFGFSAEEGMAAMNQAAQQGLGRYEARDVTRRVFDFERRTGADRGALSSLAHMSARFNAGDALGDAWAGLKASGMNTGQFNEYLRAMQRVMEEGISRGFVRSSEEVAANLTMLAQLTGGDNPLWQGEHGARRLSEMNAGLAGATALTDSSDVLALRAAMDVERESRRRHGLPYEDISWIYGQKRLERGLDVDMFERIMALSSMAESNATEGIMHRMIDIFGLDYTNAHALYQGWRGGRHEGMNELRALMGQQVGPPAADSRELEARGITEGIRNWWTTEGMAYWDKQLPKLRDALRGAKGRPVDTTGMSHWEATAALLAEQNSARRSGDAERAFRADQQQRLNEMLHNNPNANDAGREFLRFGVGTRLMFGNNRRDRADLNTIGNIFADAANSSDAGQRAMAQDFADRVWDVPRDVREGWNRTNNVNLLANANDMAQMLAKLDRLIYLTEKQGEVTLTIEDLVN